MDRSFKLLWKKKRRRRKPWFEIVLGSILYNFVREYRSNDNYCTVRSMIIWRKMNRIVEEERNRRRSETTFENGIGNNKRGRESEVFRHP